MDSGPYHLSNLTLFYIGRSHLRQLAPDSVT